MSLSHNLAKSIVKKNLNIEDVILMLRKYKLLTLLPSVLRNIKQMHSIESERENISIETPFRLHDDALNKIQTIIGDTSAPHTVSIKKEILAGFKARFKGKLYDGSAKRIIKQLVTNYKN